MPNRQKLRKQRKEEDLRRRGVAPRRQPPANVDAVSPLVQKIMRGGPAGLGEGLTQLLLESAPLRQEPEFRDLHFDSMRAADVSARIFPQYQQRLGQAEHESQEERQEIYDEFRIEAIDELTTPEFRQDLLRRLDRCAARFLQEGKRERWETVSLLRTVLDQPKISWGICMLVITLFSEALREAEQLYDVVAGLFGDLVNQLGRTTDLSEILTASARPAQIETLARKLDGEPGLRARMEQQARVALGHFEDDIFWGKYDLQLFRTEEIMRAFQCYSDYLERHPLEWNSSKTEQAAEPLAECIERTVREIATPERLAQLVNDLEQTAHEWLRQGKPEGALLHIEGGSLVDDQTPENYLLYTFFAGQMRRMSKEAHVSGTPS